MDSIVRWLLVVLLLVHGLIQWRSHSSTLVLTADSMLPAPRSHLACATLSRSSFFVLALKCGRTLFPETGSRPIDT